MTESTPWSSTRALDRSQIASIATAFTLIATGFINIHFYNFLYGLHVANQLKKVILMSAYLSPDSSSLDRITLNFRMRDHRFTSLPVKDILKIRMKDLQLKNADMRSALDYAKPNVIAMMKMGTMRLPANKALIAAELLKLDPVFLLGKVIAENDPALWDAISAVMGEYLLTKNELALINMVRQALDGHDVDLAGSPVFVEAVAHELQATRDRENALTQAAINRIDK